MCVSSSNFVNLDWLVNHCKVKLHYMTGFTGLPYIQHKETLTNLPITASITESGLWNFFRYIQQHHKSFIYNWIKCFIGFGWVNYWQMNFNLPNSPKARILCCTVCSGPVIDECTIRMFLWQLILISDITFWLFVNVVKCLKCWNTSDTYDPLLDISVETKNCPTLGKALKKITKPDMLDGDNKYSCPKWVL